MVFATGNIVLTFPAVTAADDGLEFTVKNTGIYSDLVSLVGYAGALIDNNVTVTLSRWKARTFIAKGGNWFFKEREVMKDNYLDVGAFSSFNTIAGVVAFMNLHMDGPTVVQLGPGTFTIDATQVIDLPYPVVFVGSSYGATRIVGAAGVSGTPLFDCKTECYFKMLDFTAYSNASGNNGLNLTGSGVYHEIKDCAFTGFNKGIVSTTNHSLIWVFEVAFVNCTGAGIEIADGSAIGGYLKMSECTFAQCKIGINLLSGVNETVSLNSAVFTNTVSGTDIGIQYIPATFTSITSMYISGNSWNNEGTYMSGFDFERTDGRDANVFLMNNVGMENENPHFKITLLNNTTTVAADGTTWVKANWTDTSPILTVYTCKWDLSTIVNRFRYLSRNKADVIMWISGNVASTSGSNRTISMAICKNGVTTARYGETTLRTVTQNYPYQFSTVVYLSDTGPGDYFELFFNSTNGITDRIVISDLNWYSDAH
jgi:hypothetical protein